MPMVFPSSPTVGQVFSSGGRSWVWTGSTWDSPSASTAALSGLTLIADIPFSGVTTIAADNVFTSNYLNYKVVFNGLHSGSAAAYRVQLRNAGSNITSAYFYQGNRSIASSLNNLTGNNVSDWIAGYASSGENIFIDSDVFNPATTGLTGIGLKSFSFESPSFMCSQIGGQERQNLTRDGFRIFASAGTFTGTMKIYGYRNQ